MPTEKTLAHQFTLSVERVRDFEFIVRFPQGDTLLRLDEPAPLGHDRGPNAARVLTAAVANCLSASLLFCLQKSRHAVVHLAATATTTVAPNARGRWRIANIAVELQLTLADGTPQQARQCVGLFEDFCTVTESVRQGIPVSVAVVDGNGERLYGQAHE